MKQHNINQLQATNPSDAFRYVRAMLIIIWVKMGFLIKIPKFAVCK